MKKLDLINFYVRGIKIPLFLIFFIFSKLNADENIIFPFENKIYSFDTNKQKFNILFASENLFLKDFYIKDNEYFFIEKESDIIKLVSLNSKNRLNKIFEGEYSNIIIAKGYFLTFSKYINKNGFEFSIFKLDSKEKIYSFNLDFLLSDYEVKDNLIFLAGSDTRDFKNYLFIIDCGSKKILKILEEKKNGDFLKIVIDKEFIYVYNSSMPAKNNNKYIYKINLLNYNNKDRYNFDIKNKICYFYGKGFSFNNEIFLPLIDEQYNITLFSIDKNFKRKRSICLETGLYKIIKKSDNYIYFIGYNYFKDKTKFYFCYFYPNEDKITYLKIN